MKRERHQPLVHVCAYTRYRLGKLEWVTAHTRRYPNS
jgi:hypothetical protein